MFNIIPNKHLSGGIAPESLKEKQGMVITLQDAKEDSTSTEMGDIYICKHSNWYWMCMEWGKMDTKRSHGNRKHVHTALWWSQRVLTFKFCNEGKSRHSDLYKMLKNYLRKGNSCFFSISSLNSVNFNGTNTCVQDTNCSLKAYSQFNTKLIIIYI